jgi:hypothetical protein
MQKRENTEGKNNEIEDVRQFGFYNINMTYVYLYFIMLSSMLSQIKKQIQKIIVDKSKTIYN